MPLSSVARVAVASLVALASAGAQVLLTGRVVDENEAPVGNARVSVRSGQATLVEANTGPAGGFRLELPGPGSYLVSVDRAGYYHLENRPLQIDTGGADLTLVLNPQREVFQSVTAGQMPTPIDTAQTQDEERLSGTEVNDIPYPASHSLRNSMKLIPGVVQDTAGGLHFHGGAEYQTRYLLDGFDISDPVDGHYTTLLAVEGVRSLDLYASRQSPQYGRESAGTLDINPENGTDRFHYTATNFIPGVDSRGGVRFGGWTPRAVISGPLVKGRAWFSDSFNGEYNNGFVSGLPSGQNTNPQWRAGNLLHTQVNLTPANILYGDLLTNFDHQAHYGLGVLDPISTSIGVSDNEWLAAVKDSHTWYGGALLEAGFAWQRVFTSRAPEGTAPYVISPQGRSGNYFVHSRQSGRRTQAFVNYFPRARTLAGRHQLQVGADAQRLDYRAHMFRTSYLLDGNSGLPLLQTSFEGSGRFSRPNTVFATYINDHWQPLPRVTIDAGLRQDWDQLIARVALSPRIGVAWAPFAGLRTKVSAGFAVLHDATSLALLSRPLDQAAVTTPFSDTGAPLPPLVTTFVPGRDLRLPRYNKWSAGVERDLGRRLFAGLEWQRKRGSTGFVYAPLESATALPVSIQPLTLAYGLGGTYALSNQRQDAYDEVTVSARQSFGDQYGWMASYTRSRAVSNAVLDASVDQPLQVLDNLGPVPWDVPNRLLSWGYFPVHGKNWAAAFMVDYRTGFPFSVSSDAGVVMGPVDSRRYPSTFDLNIHLERRFVFRGYRFALRVGCNNVTDHRNPTAVGSVIGSPDYLQFFGDEGRHFVVRIRMFGRAGR